MDCLHGLFEHKEQRKALASLHALKRHVLPVFDPGVFSHARRSVEAFPTDVADVRPFCSATPHMFFSYELQFVSVTPNATGKWFLISVWACSHVADHLTPGVCQR